MTGVPQVRLSARGAGAGEGAKVPAVRSTDGKAPEGAARKIKSNAGGAGGPQA